MIPEFKDKENYDRMQGGEFYYPFAPEFLAARRNCAKVCRRFNQSEDLTRRQMVELWNEMTCNDRPIPPPDSNLDNDDALLQDHPWVERPIRLSYGFNVKTGEKVHIESNCVILDTGTVSIGSRTRIGRNVSLFASTYPVDPKLRNGIKGSEQGGNIDIGQDCFIGENVIVLPGVTIGDGCTISAGSVVTKNIPPNLLAAGNPARIVRHIAGHQVL
ncbi:hypothetical protein N7456_010840 [Penicillium angulare]|uniref:Maltose/galactoside acetyltransferase domain-containing protein n=1 Tax=Penicillium angulare TaxID=116970 RepID=A0A9W9JZ50_9EURO|nr:hypothetical protein N7456_010840 [Penicillium angulare]